MRCDAQLWIRSDDSGCKVSIQLCVCTFILSNNLRSKVLLQQFTCVLFSVNKIC